jgi:hypothetical protein
MKKITNFSTAIIIAVLFFTSACKTSKPVAKTPPPAPVHHYTPYKEAIIPISLPKEGIQYHTSSDTVIFYRPVNKSESNLTPNGEVKIVDGVYTEWVKILPYTPCVRVNATREMYKGVEAPVYTMQVDTCDQCQIKYREDTIYTKDKGRFYINYHNDQQGIMYNGKKFMLLRTTSGGTKSHLVIDKSITHLDDQTTTVNGVTVQQMSNLLKKQATANAKPLPLQPVEEKKQAQPLPAPDNDVHPQD